MGAISLSVIIPAFNEENRIVGTVSEIDQYMKSRGCGYEIIVVDDGSTDATVPAVLSMKGKVSNLNILRNGVNRGKGFSVKNGFLHANGEILLFTDADLSTPIDEFGKLLEYILQGYDIAIGSRGLPDSDIVVHQPWYREFMGKTFNLLVRLLAVSGIRDTQCGFKMFRRECAFDICKAQRMDGFSFDVELLYLARKRKYRIKEVPVRWINSPKSKVRIMRDSGRMLANLVNVRINDLRGYYT